MAQITVTNLTGTPIVLPQPLGGLIAAWGKRIYSNVPISALEAPELLVIANARKISISSQEDPTTPDDIEGAVVSELSNSPFVPLTRRVNTGFGLMGGGDLSADLTISLGTLNDTLHGNRGGGTLHAAATPAAAGFMSAADKTKLDGIPNIRAGAGDPNGVVTGSPGDLYLNTNGGASTTLYVKESGIGTNTGWVGK